MAVTLIGTLAFTQVDAHTNEVMLALFLFVRGLGFGAAMMPSMGAAYQTLAPSDIPRASTTINILQRVGGSVATALVAVELQRGIASRLPGLSGGGSEGALAASSAQRLPEAVADKVGAAFGETFWWIVGLSAVGFVSSLLLPRHPARPAHGAAGPDAAATEPSAAVRQVVAVD
jgi:hypothetical protein